MSEQDQFVWAALTLFNVVTVAMHYRFWRRCQILLADAEDMQCVEGITVTEWGYRQTSGRCVKCRDEASARLRSVRMGYPTVTRTVTEVVSEWTPVEDGAQ